METLLSLLKAINPSEFIPKLWKFVRRAKLKIYLDPDPEQAYQIAALADMNFAKGFFCHLMVTNDGHETAKNCRGRLLQISVCDQNGIYRRDSRFGNPVVLKWAHELDFAPRDLESKIPKRLDLCYAVETNPNLLIFFTPQLPDGNRTVYPPGKYQVRIRADADNTTYTDSDFNIDFNGAWNKIHVSPVSKP